MSDHYQEWADRVNARAREWGLGFQATPEMFRETPPEILRETEELIELVTAVEQLTGQPVDLDEEE